MSEHELGQVAASAAEIYERFFVPALFTDWPPQILQAAEVTQGQTVLDVACGTGILARAAFQWVGDTGHVSGVDINDGMLAVAKDQNADIDWQQGQAESLPFEDATFDHVVSQFGLMFFQDRRKAITEMLRVMKPGHKACIAVWASLSATPGYAAVATMLNDVFNAEIAQSIEAPYCLGDARELASIVAEAGACNVAVNTVAGKARFDSIDDWLFTDIKGWTLADVIDDNDYERLRRGGAKISQARFANKNGKVVFEAPANLVTFSS